MSQEEAMTYLKNERERVIHSKDHQEHDFVYYVFQQDLRDKFTKILG